MVKMIDQNFNIFNLYWICLNTLNFNISRTDWLKNRSLKIVSGLVTPLCLDISAEKSGKPRESPEKKQYPVTNRD